MYFSYEENWNFGIIQPEYSHIPVPVHSKLCINHEADRLAFPGESDSIERNFNLLEGFKNLE